MPPLSDLFRATFRFYRAYAPILGGYLAWLLIPYTCLTLFQFVPDGIVKNIGKAVFEFAAGIMGIWIFIFLSQLIHELIHNRETDPVILRKQTRNLFVPVIAVGFLYALIVFGGIALLIIPGILFFVWFALAQLAVILERKRGWEAFTFSKSLVRGHFFRAAAIIYTGPFVFSAGLMIAVLGIGAVISSIVGLQLFAASNEAPLWLEIIDILIQLFVMIPLTLIYSIFAYDVLNSRR